MLALLRCLHYPALNCPPHTHPTPVHSTPTFTYPARACRLRQAVRLAPHEIEDRLGPAQRWGFFAAEPQGVEGAEESGEAVQSAAAEVTAEESVVVHASGRQQDFPDL